MQLSLSLQKQKYERNSLKDFVGKYAVQITNRVKPWIFGINKRTSQLGFLLLEISEHFQEEIVSLGSHCEMFRKTFMCIPDGYLKTVARKKGGEVRHKIFPLTTWPQMFLIWQRASYLEMKSINALTIRIIKTFKNEIYYNCSATLLPARRCEWRGYWAFKSKEMRWWQFNTKGNLKWKRNLFDKSFMVFGYLLRY